jgi:hypothetical protein
MGRAVFRGVYEVAYGVLQQAVHWAVEGAGYWDPPHPGLGLYLAEVA